MEMKIKNTSSSRSFFSNWEYIFLILIIPYLQILEFFVLNSGEVQESSIEKKSLLPYLYLVIFSWIIIKSKFEYKQVFLLVYFLCYTFLFQEFSISNNASYMINIVITLSLFNLLQYDRLIILSRLQNLVFIVSILIIITVYYLYSEERFFEDRFYIVGFIIPHAFSYYCAIFVFYFLSRKRWILSVITILAGVYVGARSGILAILVAIASFFVKWRYIKSLFKFIIIIIFFSWVLLFNYWSKTSYIENLETVFASTFSGISNDEDQASSNATRTVLAANMLVQVLDDGVSINNIFGRGPRSSYSFNNSTLGLELWMHNDLLEILFTLGIVGLCLYLYSLYAFYIQYRNIYFIIFILVLALTNGFFTYIPVTTLLLFKLIDSNIKYLKQKY